VSQCEAVTPPQLTPARQIRCVLEDGHEPVYVGDQCVGHNYGGLGPYSPRLDQTREALVGFGEAATKLTQILQAAIPTIKQAWDVAIPILVQLGVQLTALEAELRREQPVPPDHVQ